MMSKFRYSTRSIFAIVVVAAIASLLIRWSLPTTPKWWKLEDLPEFVEGQRNLDAVRKPLTSGPFKLTKLPESGTGPCTLRLPSIDANGNQWTLDLQNGEYYVILYLETQDRKPDYFVWRGTGDF